MPHAGISVRLGVPVGSIGPRRSRCLDKLRRSPPLAVLTGTGVSNPEGEIDMAPQWWSDDDKFLASLGDALREADAVPRSMVEAGKAVFTWRNIDAELATLTHDSAHEESWELAATRFESAPLRYLTFTSMALTIELEITSGALLGQIVPPKPGEIEVLMTVGPVVTTTINEIGYFAIRPIPSDPFRLLCHFPAGADVLTGWITP
jgi:hypothetical protein